MSRSALVMMAALALVATSVLGCSSARPDVEIASTHQKGEVHVILTDRTIDQIDGSVRSELRRMQRDVVLPDRGYEYDVVDGDQYYVSVRIRQAGPGEVEVAVHVTDSPNRQSNTARAKETLNRLLDAIY